jgi:hypothetical protein
MRMIYFRTEFNMTIFNGSLVMAIRHQILHVNKGHLARFRTMCQANLDQTRIEQERNRKHYILSGATTRTGHQTRLLLNRFK